MDAFPSVGRISVAIPTVSGTLSGLNQKRMLSARPSSLGVTPHVVGCNEAAGKPVWFHGSLRNNTTLFLWDICYTGYKREEFRTSWRCKHPHPPATHTHTSAKLHPHTPMKSNQHTNNTQTATYLPTSPKKEGKKKEKKKEITTF